MTEKIKVEFSVIPHDHVAGDDVWCYDNLKEALHYATQLSGESIILCDVDHTHKDGHRSLYTAFEIVVVWGNCHMPIEVVDKIFQH